MSKISEFIKEAKEDWSQMSHLEAFYIILIIGSIIALPIILFANRVEPTSDRATTNSTNNSSKVLTVEQANTYVGKTLKDFCIRFGDYVNVHTYAFSMEHGGGGTPCSEVGKGYYFDNYIISQAYYDEEYLSSSEYRDKQKYCEDYPDSSACDKPLTVYVDSMPENEAREAGIQIK